MGAEALRTSLRIKHTEWKEPKIRLAAAGVMLVPVQKAPPRQPQSGIPLPTRPLERGKVIKCPWHNVSTV